jgi:hypothetical protein
MTDLLPGLGVEDEIRALGCARNDSAPDRVGRKRARVQPLEAPCPWRRHTRHEQRGGQRGRRLEEDRMQEVVTGFVLASRGQLEPREQLGAARGALLVHALHRAKSA